MKYQSYPLLSYFSVAVCLRCLLHLFLSLTASGKPMFSLSLCSSWWVQIVGYVLACRSYSVVCTWHDLIFIIGKTYRKILKTYKMPVRYILSSVWVRLNIFSQLSVIQYMGLCVFSLPISLVMMERIYALSYNHHQIGSINYYPLFRVR